MFGYCNASDSPRSPRQPAKSDDDDSQFWDAFGWVVGCVANLLPFVTEIFMILAGIVTLATLVLKTVKL